MVSFGLDSVIVPEQPLLATTPPGGADWRHQVKWDGVRMLAFVGPDGVRLQNRRLRDRTAHYPELAALRQQCRGTAILDGELIVLHAGRPSFAGILHRDLARPERSAAQATTLPVHYMVFDLLHADDEDLSDRPLAERQERLTRMLQPSETVQLVEDFADGAALFAAIAARGMEGIVSKRRTSPYRQGKQSDWLKTKCRRRVDCVVGGAAFRGGRLAALLLGLYDAGGRLTYVGRAGSGLTDEQAQVLTQYFRVAGGAPPPFVAPPRPSGVTVAWCRPELVVTIAYHEWTEQLSLRAPVIVGFSKRPAGECRFE